MRQLSLWSPVILDGSGLRGILMSCDNGHTDCIGPICTIAASPKRPLIGCAKTKAEIFQKLKDKCYYFASESATTATIQYSMAQSATIALLWAKDIVAEQKDWNASYRLWNVRNDWFVKLSLTKAKV